MLGDFQEVPSMVAGSGSGQCRWGRVRENLYSLILLYAKVEQLKGDVYVCMCENSIYLSSVDTLVKAFGAYQIIKDDLPQARSLNLIISTKSLPCKVAFTGSSD